MTNRPAVQTAGSVDTNSTQAATLSQNLSLTSGFGSILVACAHLRGTHTISTFTFGGTALTLAYNTYYNTGCYPRCAVYYILHPSTVASTQLQCVINSAADWGMGWIYLHWAKTNGSSPFSYVGEHEGGGATQPSASCSSGSNDLVIDFLTRCNESGGYTDVATGTQNYWGWTTRSPLSTRTHLGSQYKDGTGSSVSMGWTFGGSTGAFHHRAMSVAPFEGVPHGMGIAVFAERWKGFMKDLKQGLVPPSELQKKYGDLVSI